MDEQLVLKNRLKGGPGGARSVPGRPGQLVGVSRQTISSIETGQFNPTAKLALVLCIALDKNLRSFSISEINFSNFWFNFSVISRY